MLWDDRLGPRWLSGSVTIGLIGPLFLTGVVKQLEREGKLVVNGYEDAEQFLEKGRVILIANHIDGFTMFLMTGIFWRRYHTQPRFNFYNMPREGLIPTALLRYMMRCLLIKRGDTGYNDQTFAEAQKLLERSGVFLIFPEGTRTIDPDNPVKLIERYGRRIRPIYSGSKIAKLAENAKASILPVYFDVPDVTRKMGLRSSLRHIKEQGRIVTVSFGKPLVPSGTRGQIKKQFEEGILSAGLE